MSNNVYSEINLHLTRHMKGSAPLIHDAVEHHLHRFLEQPVKQMPEAICHAVRGTDDHVHLAVWIPPTVQVSGWVSQLTGAGAPYLNQYITNRNRFTWQAGYGVGLAGLALHVPAAAGPYAILNFVQKREADKENGKSNALGRSGQEPGHRGKPHPCQRRGVTRGAGRYPDSEN